MNRRDHGLMIVLCGVPGSGKSTLARFLVKLAEQDGYPVKHIHFDQVLHDMPDFDPSVWKVRTFIYLAYILYDVMTRIYDYVVQVSRDACMEEAGRYLSNGYIVIMDDTMHYRSMRLECWKIARVHSSCYCQVLLDCEFSLCCQRNEQRSGTEKVPSQVMDRMREIFEPPKGDKYPWDSLTIVMHPEDSTHRTWREITSNFWNNPAPPLQVESELDPTIRQLTTETIIHQVDIQSRKIIGEYVGRLSNSHSKGEIAMLMNTQRQDILDKCRKSAHTMETFSIEHTLESFRSICDSITSQYDT